MADWLATCGITTVALDSTGGDGMPLLEPMETKGFEVLRVAPPQVQQIQGRPTSDGHDGQWRPRLQTVGLLARALRPPDQGCVLRSDRRPRAMCLTDASQPSQPRPQALTPMHLTRPHVVSDVTGETGLALRRARLAGARDPMPWARLRNERGHHDAATMAKALHGQWRAAHRCAVAHAVALYARSHEKIAECDRPLEAPLATFADCQDREAVRPVVRPRPRTRNRPHVDVRGSLHRSTGGDVTAMEGLDAPTAWTRISEIGLDMGRWPTVKHCTSWLGRCPHHRVSGGTG